MINKKYKPFVISSIVVILLWTVNLLFLYKLDSTERGTFGDMFGAVNSLFTGLSFAGIIYAMYLQNKELSLQRRELKDTRSVMKEQSDTMKLQTAESSFFRLLENHRNLVFSLTFGGGQGYGGLNIYYTDLKNRVEEYFRASITGKLYKKEIAGYYPIKWLSFQNENIEQLINNIYHIVRFIKYKLNDDVFYHETFYKSLSKPEKYILGLYYFNIRHNNLEDFVEVNFDYLNDFHDSGNARYVDEKMDYFPYLDFNFKKTLVQFSTRDILNRTIPHDLGKLIINVIENYKEEKIILKRVILGFDLIENEFHYECDIEIQEVTEVDLFQIVWDNLCLKTINTDGMSFKQGSSFLYFKLCSVIEYGNRRFEYVSRYSFQLVESGFQFLSSNPN